MPNHVTNQLTFDGTQEQLQKLFDTVITHCPSVPKTSFHDSVIYKKEGESYEFGWLADDGKTFSERVNGNITVTSTDGVPADAGWVLEMTEAHDEFDFEKIIPMPTDILRGDLSMEDQKASNVRNWYDWSIKNWGTKWSAYDNYIDRDNNITKFDTAWSPPTPVIEHLAVMFPEISFTHEYFDEGHGFWGRDVYAGGIKIVDGYEKGDLTDLGKVLAIKLKGYDPDEEYAEDEDEEVTLAGGDTSVESD